MTPESQMGERLGEFAKNNSVKEMLGKGLLEVLAVGGSA
jgi:hypothetical protein